MRSPWGAYYGTSGAWVTAPTSLTVTDMAGPVGAFEIVVTYSESGNLPNLPTATDGGGAFSYIHAENSGICLLGVYGRLLTNTNTHSVTASGSGFLSTANYKRMSVWIVMNPMNIPYSEISTMYRSVDVYDAGGTGNTTYFPDCTALKSGGATRLDIGVAWRQYDNTGGIQQGNSVPWESWNTANMNGFYSTPYYNYSNGNGVGWGSGSSARQLEDVGRYTYSVFTNNQWGDGGFGQIPYTNKCYNSSSASYVSLFSRLAGFSFVIPNYGGTQMVL